MERREMRDREKREAALPEGIPRMLAALLLVRCPLCSFFLSALTFSLLSLSLCPFLLSALFLSGAHLFLSGARPFFPQGILSSRRAAERFFGAITTGCMRPFVPRTNENEITTTFFGGGAETAFRTCHRSHPSAHLYLHFHYSHLILPLFCHLSPKLLHSFLPYRLLRNIMEGVKLFFVLRGWRLDQSLRVTILRSNNVFDLKLLTISVCGVLRGVPANHVRLYGVPIANRRA